MQHENNGLRLSRAGHTGQRQAEGPVLRQHPERRNAGYADHSLHYRRRVEAGYPGTNTTIQSATAFLQEPALKVMDKKDAPGTVRGQLVQVK